MCRCRSKNDQLTRDKLYHGLPVPGSLPQHHLELWSHCCLRMLLEQLKCAYEWLRQAAGHCKLARCGSKDEAAALWTCVKLRTGKTEHSDVQTIRPGLCELTVCSSLQTWPVLWLHINACAAGGLNMLKRPKQAAGMCRSH